MNHLPEAAAGTGPQRMSAKRPTAGRPRNAGGACPDAGEAHQDAGRWLSRAIDPSRASRAATIPGVKSVDSLTEPLKIDRRGSPAWQISGRFGARFALPEWQKHLIVRASPFQDSKIAANSLHITVCCAPTSTPQPAPGGP